MKKTTVLIALCAVFGAVHARQDIQYEVGKHQVCERMADYGALTWRGAHVGTPTSVSKRAQAQGNYMAPMLAEIEQTVSKNAAVYTERDAMLEAWGICMGNIDRLTRNHNARQ